MSPRTKKLLSSLAVTVGGAALASVQQAISAPPFTLHTLLVAAAAGSLAGLVHYLPAFGTKDELAAQVTAKVAEAISKEAP